MIYRFVPQNNSVYHYYDIHISQHNSILYIIILIYLNSYGSRTVYYHYDILFFLSSFILYITILISYSISQPKLYITTLISDFSYTFLPFFKIRCSACETILFYSLLLWDDSITRFWLWDNPVPTVSLSIPLYLTISVVIRFCNIQFWLGISLLFPFFTPFVSLTVLVIKPY